MIIDGLRYHYREQGSGPAIVLLHGFTGSSASWEAVSERLADAGWRVIAPDLPGHGETAGSWDAQRYRIERTAADLIALTGGLGVAQFALLGYSMGGRLALYTALTYPEHVRALILESASPGLADPAEREARRHADERLADRIEREGIDAFVQYWDDLPLFSGLRRLPEAQRARLRAERLRRDPRGLAASLRGMGTGAQPSLWERLGELAMPVLLIAGAEDGKYAAIARRMAAAIPGAAIAIVPGSGHVVHEEQREPFNAAITTFLAALPGAPRRSETSP
ncbi:MAG: 2-succinyl-6-hydroxy-2,4-cyclohexadiene-1-carboxylate synthase [Candidatus Flexifilum sp.]|jgi:2-succinyl-6-hydroxy-2,4-cyclohexadiene-1-carboxylate synthase